MLRDATSLVVLRRAMAATAVMAALCATAFADETRIEIELFGREGCPHCAAAEAYLHALERRRPELRVLRRDVAADPAALERLRALAAQAGVAQAAVPAIYVRGRLLVGWDSPETTGRSLLAWLDAGAAPGDETASVCDPSQTVACPQPSERPHGMRVPWLGEIDVRELGLPLFTVAVGLVDGFNPCAMWVLLFVLSMLVHFESRPRMALIGGTFVLVSGAVYFAFMAAWLNFFLLVGISRAVQVTLGVIAVAIGAVHVKDFFAFGKGPSLSIPKAAKPGIYRRVREVLHAERLTSALLGTIVLAVMVNVVELLCTAGLPALYTQVLTSQQLSVAAYYAYLALYNAAYVLDDAAMLAVALVTLSHTKLQERGGRVLKLVSGVVMAALGLLLLLAPQWLAWS